MIAGAKDSNLVRIDRRGRATLSSGYRRNGTDGRLTTSAPKSSLGTPLGAKISTSSPRRRKHSTVLVNIVTIPSILGRNGSVIRAILILAVFLYSDPAVASLLEYMRQAHCLVTAHDAGILKSQPETLRERNVINRVCIRVLQPNACFVRLIY